MSNIGGYAGIVWQLAGLLFGWYSSFKFENDLGNMLYSKDKKYITRESSRVDHKEELKATLDNREDFTFSFWEFFCL